MTVDAGSEPAAISTANLKNTNPNLYGTLVRFALGCVGLGSCFLLWTPTFEQYGIPKELIGAGFMALGVAYLVLLNVRRNLKAVRIVIIVSVIYKVFWGIGTLQTVQQGLSSPQLFVLYATIAAVEWQELKEPFFNSVTSNGVGG